jgi:indolepyruvate ferredoxin oxidoreductase, alpha subunit
MKNPPKNTAFLSGDEALAQGAYEAGLKVACSYPGTPATEILEYLTQFKEVDTQWSVNEKVAFEVAYGACTAGARSMYSSKHVGLNVAMDPLMTAAYIGVNAGFVIVVADDPGLHSSQNEQDTRLLAKAAKIPLLEPSSPAEAKEFVTKAFDISEKYDTPVMIRLTTRIAHTKENVEAGQRREIANKEYKTSITKNVMVPGYAYKRHIELEKRLVALKTLSENSEMNAEEPGDKKTGIIADSVAYLYAKEMYPDASFLKIGFINPFPDKKVIEFAKKVKEIIVIEEQEPVIEDNLRMLGLKFKAKHPSFRIGELKPELIPLIVAGKEKVEVPAGTRKPVLCPGCMHRPVFNVLRKLKATVTGDIGCYTLGALAPLNALHTCLCMGASVTFFEGFTKALGKGVVGIIGDSTFVHSGITGLVNAAYNNAKGLVIILDNGTTAMTGSQPHPATGKTAKGAETSRLVLEELCKACGAANVDVVDPYDSRKLEALIKQRMNEEALSVLIARAPCRLIDRSRKPAPTYIKEKCTKCGICVALDCPALTKTEDGYISINTDQCTGCNLCVEVCKFDALKANGK